MLLILTSDQDLTADFLIVRLRRRGLPYFRINAEDWAAANYTYCIDAETVRRDISLGPKVLDLEQVCSVWYRRALQPSPSAILPRSERAFIAGELRHFATGIVLNP